MILETLIVYKSIIWGCIVIIIICLNYIFDSKELRLTINSDKHYIVSINKGQGFI